MLNMRHTSRIEQKKLTFKIHFFILRVLNKYLNNYIFIHPMISQFKVYYIFLIHFTYLRISLYKYLIYIFIYVLHFLHLHAQKYFVLELLVIFLAFTFFLAMFCSYFTPTLISSVLFLQSRACFLFVSHQCENCRLMFRIFILNLFFQHFRLMVATI